MTSSKPKSKKTKDIDPDVNERTGQIANLIDLSSDPDYTKLLEHYQHAEFTKCKEVLDKMEKRYPEHPGLLGFKDDLQMRLSLMDMAISTEKEEKQKKKKAILKISIFSIMLPLL